VQSNITEHEIFMINLLESGPLYKALLDMLQSMDFTHIYALNDMMVMYYLKTPSIAKIT